MISSLYLHVPFCERKCEYCDFPSLAGALDQQHAYVTTLRRELRALGPLAGAAALETVFVGGGTPSLVDPELLHEVMDEVRSAFRLAPSPEVTLEANPSSTSKERARAWLDAGFTRVSIGVQSLEPDILAFLGRVHDPERALMALREVRQAGFENVNCDLIYAVPGLDDARWVATLERVIDASPDHISAYELTVEQGTPLHVAVSRGRVRPVDEETALRQHRAAIEILHGAGYSQYEVSNFA
ncbi:MAG TPA: coproporphyrinogen-III oxidase family protein, partial [Candidatus Sulfotelmatobacter sp.]|nr:coproporphyrinogen-III oxidase family protein [Candidatus Sulfotelmatobacter sp.]